MTENQVDSRSVHWSRYSPEYGDRTAACLDGLFSEIEHVQRFQFIDSIVGGGRRFRAPEWLGC